MTQSKSTRFRGASRAFCVVAAVVGLLSLLVNGQAGLAWGLGWGLPVCVAWALALGMRSGIIQGLSAGLYTGVGLGSFTFGLGILGNIFLRGLFWGVLGGIFLAFVWRWIESRFAYLLVAHFGAALAAGMVGTVLVGVIGEVLGDFTLSGAGFIIGVLLMGPVWAICSTLGLVLGHLLFKLRSSEVNVA